MITNKAKKIQQEKREQIIDDWNKKYPEGTPVILTDDLGNKHETVTRSIAWDVCGSPVVKVNGISGGYLLERVKPRI